MLLEMRVFGSYESAITSDRHSVSDSDSDSFLSTTFYLFQEVKLGVGDNDSTYTKLEKVDPLREGLNLFETGNE